MRNTENLVSALSDRTIALRALDGASVDMRIERGRLWAELWDAGAGLYVTPLLAVDDHADSGPADPELVSKLSMRNAARGISCSNCDNGFRCQYGATVSFAYVGGPSACAVLFRHVRHILGMCSKPQMGGVAAWWVVAVMTNAKAIGNRAIGQFPCESMGEDGLTVLAAHAPISVCDEVSSPWPTRIRAARPIYATPQTISVWEPKDYGFVGLNRPGFAKALVMGIAKTAGAWDASASVHRTLSNRRDTAMTCVVRSAEAARKERALTSGDTAKSWRRGIIRGRHRNSFSGGPVDVATSRPAFLLPSIIA